MFSFPYYAHTSRDQRRKVGNDEIVPQIIWKLIVQKIKWKKRHKETNESVRKIRYSYTKTNIEKMRKIRNLRKEKVGKMKGN